MKMMPQERVKRYEEIIFPGKIPWYPTGQLDLYISVMSVMRSDGAFSNEQFSPAVACHVVHKGVGVLHYNNREIQIGPGHLFILWPGCHAKYYDFPESPWEYTWFFLKGTKLQWLFTKLGMNQNEPVYDVTKCPRFFRCIKKVVEDFRQGTHSPLFPVSAAWEIFEALGRDMNRKIQPFSDNLAEACRLYIETWSNLASIPNVDEMAEYFNVNRSTVYRDFKEKYGISPKKYIENARFKKACQLLESGQLNVKDVAKTCGYENPCYFSAAFAKHFGLSPSKWKNSNNLYTQK